MNRAQRGELYARFVSRLLSRDTGERGLETRYQIMQAPGRHAAGP
jgi:hypothetical protein